MKSICNLMEEAEKLAGQLTAKQVSPKDAQKIVSDIQGKIKAAKKAAPTIDKQYLQQVNSKLKQFAVSGAVDPATGKRIPPEDIARMIVDMGNAGNISRFLREAKKATSWDMLTEAWINGLLSNPTTHAVNTISTGLSTAWQVPERLLASFYGKMLPGDSVPVEEALQHTYGMLEGAIDGFKAFGRNIKTGIEPDMFSKVDVPVRRAISAKNMGVNEDNFLGRAIDLFGSAVRLPTRFLSATDSGFKATGYRMELRARALRQAKLEAKQNGWTRGQMAKRMHDIIENPPDDIKLDAINQANYQTFTKELGPAGQSVMTMMRKVDETARVPIMRLVAPFIRTPINLVKYAGERSPLAAIAPSFWKEVAAGGARRDLALAKMSLGSLVMGIAVKYAAEGRITGGGPKDGRLRGILRDNGWQPYSVRVGDKWYSYARLEPFSTLMGVAADFAEIAGQVGEEEREKLALAATMSIIKNVTSKTYLKGFSEALQALDEPERYGESFIANYAKSLIPSGVGQIERLEDPELRSTYSHEGFYKEILNAVKSRVPGYSDELPLNRNLWGEPVLLGPGWGTDIVTNLVRMGNPIYITDIGEGEPINDELIRMKYGPGKPDREQKIHNETVQLTAWEYDKFDQLINTMEMPQTGKNLKESLNELVTEDPTYQDADDNQKRQMIEGYIEQAREMAKEELYQTTDSVRKIVDVQMMQRYMPQAVGQ